MNNRKKHLRHLRLTLFFAMIVFMIMFLTMTLLFFGTQLLVRLDIIGRKPMGKLPLFMFCLISTILGTVLAAIFSRAPLRPIREIIDAVDKIADGDYSVRIHLRSPEEFKILSDKFNHMAEELDSVEMLRNDFVSNFSHEFKTPIVSIRGFAKALKWDDLSPEERNEYLDIIISESERLADLSANVLYLSKIEQQTILTDKRCFNLSEQIRLTIALFDERLSEKNIRLSFDCEEYFLIGNEEMLRQVWINLLGNAIKFSPAHGMIEIRMEQIDGRISVTFSNQGPKIPAETAAHIFEKFYQGDSSHTTDGNGLGLSIAKRIVELHSGTIRLKQSEPDEITFEVRLMAQQSLI